MSRRISSTVTVSSALQTAPFSNRPDLDNILALDFTSNGRTPFDLSEATISIAYLYGDATATQVAPFPDAKLAEGKLHVKMPTQLDTYTGKVTIEVSVTLKTIVYKYFVFCTNVLTSTTPAKRNLSDCHWSNILGSYSSVALAKTNNPTAKKGELASIIVSSLNPSVVTIKNVSSSTIFINIEATGGSVHLFPEKDTEIAESLLREEDDLKKFIENKKIIISDSIEIYYFDGTNFVKYAVMDLPSAYGGSLESLAGDLEKIKAEVSGSTQLNKDLTGNGVIKFVKYLTQAEFAAIQTKLDNTEYNILG